MIGAKFYFLSGARTAAHKQRKMWKVTFFSVSITNKSYLCRCRLSRLSDTAALDCNTTMRLFLPRMTNRRRSYPARSIEDKFLRMDRAVLNPVPAFPPKVPWSELPVTRPYILFLAR